MIKISQKAKYIVQIKVETGNIAGKMSSEDHLKKKKKKPQKHRPR